MGAKTKSGWPAPSKADCQKAVEGLEALHGRVRTGVYPAWSGRGERHSCGDTPTVLESLIRTILSQNTTNANASRAWASLMRDCNGSLEQVYASGAEGIAGSIVCGGLANVKGRRIHALLDDVRQKNGSLSLEHLRGMNDATAKAALMDYEGVGPKTASCVLLFCLGRQSFAVDTHVHRIALRLGWVPPKSSREQAHDHLDARVPPALKYRLHVLLVRHGKSCLECAANHRPQRTPIGPCPLRRALHPSQTLEDASDKRRGRQRSRPGQKGLGEGIAPSR